MAEEHWERGVIERLASEGLREQVRARRWGIFFKLLTFAFLFATLLLAIGAFSDSTHTCLDKCTALVEMRGELDADAPASARRSMPSLSIAPTKPKPSMITPIEPIRLALLT